jgi:O-acetyl-ADP-ribose deacetylase (regulator of RNase III)
MNIEVIKGDITKLSIEAIVNAANSSLIGGGGVDGAIHRAGGPKIHEECMRVVQIIGGRLPTGEAVITSAGNMPSKYVIHTVGPVWKGGYANEEELLKQCYINTLKLASDFGIRAIAFPNISTGIYGFPKDKASEIAVNTVLSFIKENNVFEKVVFVCFEEENYKLYYGLLEKLIKNNQE